MAEDTEIPDVRVLESLGIVIGEAKNLGSAKDTYCTIKLDQEEVYKTEVKEKTQSPFWSEEYTFDVPREFRTLSFYVYEKDWRSTSTIGKVALRREELHRLQNKDQWFPLQAVHADSEVQGQVQVEIKLVEVVAESGQPASSLLVKCVEGSGLTIVQNRCDPYATVTLCSMARNETKRTKVKKKTVNPQFDETFQFESLRTANDRHHYAPIDEDLASLELRISLWNSWSSLGGDVFIGEVRIPIGAIDLAADRLHKAWYFLQPRESSKANNKGDIGSLRVRINYIEDHVFPSQYYEQLREVLLDSVQVQPTSASAIHILGELIKDKTQPARALVRLFHDNNRVVPMLKALTDYEVSRTSSDPNTIFRGNSLASKCVDEYMKLDGLYYLYDTLQVLLDDIFENKKSCEVDPTKLKDGESLETNMANLEAFVEQAYQAILDSAIGCPTGMCEIFYHLKEAAIKHFPDDPYARYSAVSGFVFLRFFAPAILSPKLFNLRNDNPDENVARTLKMVSKAVQTLGNHVNPDKLNANMKEEYMAPLYATLLNREHVEGIRRFLDVISSSKLARAKTIEAPIVLKEGFMTKRAQGRNRMGVGVKNFKKRWFKLTNHELSYAKCKDSEHRSSRCCFCHSESKPLCVIPVSNILAVECLEEESFQMKFMFQVVQPERALYIQANNCVEEKEWLDILSNICKTNTNRLHFYHPAAFKNGHWICCGPPAMLEGTLCSWLSDMLGWMSLVNQKVQPSPTDENAMTDFGETCCKSDLETEPGCTRVTGGLPRSITLDIDPDREMERIHSLFLANIDKLEKQQDACAVLSVYSGESSVLPPIPIEDVKACFETINALLCQIITLEQEHKKYVKMKQRQTEYGSKQAPIGQEVYNSYH